MKSGPLTWCDSTLPDHVKW